MRWVAFLCFLSFSTAALALDDCNAKFPNISQLEERLKCLQSNNNDLQSQVDALKPQVGGSSAKQAIAKPEVKPSKAYQAPPQPLTRARQRSRNEETLLRTSRDCKKAGLQWNNNANVCGAKQAIAKPEVKPSKAYQTAPQPLTRADCKKAGLQWNTNANVCSR
jgi:hypothetical protein